MFCESCSEPVEAQAILRRQNRALRQIVKSLRRSVKELREEADDRFRLICETETEAERALRELWEKAGCTCSPQDYDFMIEEAVRAMIYARVTPGSSTKYKVSPQLRTDAVGTSGCKVTVSGCV